MVLKMFLVFAVPETISIVILMSVKNEEKMNKAD